MKKILISILIILLLVLSYFALAKGIGFLKIKSINDIKNASNKLESDLNEANELSNKTYPSELENLENAIKQLKISKQEYENKNLYNTEDNALGALEIKTYKIHYLWTILGNYRKDRGVQSLTLDLKSTESEDIYDLNFTLVGSYTSITDLIYDIENDEEINFEIKNFQMNPYTVKTTETVYQEQKGEKNKITESVDNPYKTITEIKTSTTTDEKTGNYKETATESTDIYNPRWVEATFTVENVGVTLD